MLTDHQAVKECQNVSKVSIFFQISFIFENMNLRVSILFLLTLFDSLNYYLERHCKFPAVPGTLIVLFTFSALVILFNCT